MALKIPTISKIVVTYADEERVLGITMFDPLTLTLNWQITRCDRQFQLAARCSQMG
jgi:hypothetical protein